MPTIHTTRSVADRPSEPSGPFSLPATTHSYLARAADSLHEAVVAPDVPTRYACAHVAALRAAAALLSARARPAGSPGARRRPQKNAWVLLSEVAPELTEWATFFAAGGAGVFELAFDWTDGRWALVGCAD